MTISLRESRWLVVLVAAEQARVGQGRVSREPF